MKLRSILVEALKSAIMGSARGLHGYDTQTATGILATCSQLGVQDGEELAGLVRLALLHEQEDVKLDRYRRSALQGRIDTGLADPISSEERALVARMRQSFINRFGETPEMYILRRQGGKK